MSLVENELRYTNYDLSQRQIRKDHRICITLHSKYSQAHKILSLKKKLQPQKINEHTLKADLPAGMYKLTVQW